jgi:hypothetical protein
VNKYKILNTNKNFQLQVSIPTTWDFANRGDLIDDYESIVAKEMVGVPQNFEMARFSRKPIYDSNNELITSVTYEFYFADYTQNTTTPLVLNPTWYNSYELANTFTPEELRTNAKSVQKSFFKVDLYDSKDGRTQKNYLTLILNGSLSLPTEVVTSSSTTTTTITYKCTKFSIFGHKAKGILYTNCCNTRVTYQFLDEDAFSTEICVSDGTTITIFFFENDAITETTIPAQEATITGVDYDGDLFDLIVLTEISDCTCVNSDGSETNFTINTTTNITISDVIQSLAPTFELDHIGLKESYFIYWFKDFDILKLDKLYMRVKFFNGKTGEYTTFTTRKQTSINANSPFRINNDYFYREVTFDFVNYLYDVIGFGKSLLTLDWYEYINPPKNNG